jgi:hypothetical protein
VENVEILVVEDHVLKYPILLGHTFTELPNIMIIKTPNQLVFKKTSANKLILRTRIAVTIKPREVNVIPVDSHDGYNGVAYINGSLRGSINEEYYLFPGEYTLRSGLGLVIVFNACNRDLTFDKEILVTRASPVNYNNEILSYAVNFDDAYANDTVPCGSNLTKEQKEQLHDLLSKYSDCFSSGLKDLGLTTAGEMVIELENNQPVVYRPYRMSFTERNLTRNMVSEMLDAGIVKESSSPYASPVVLVKKKTGDKRLCVDYRALNRRTKKDHYPLPRVEDQLDRLAGNKLFVSLDLASGYYQIPISPLSQSKTAFITPDGQYEYTRMPFGLVNAPSVFQRTMNKILSEAKIKYALIYMDDILIPARDFEEGLSRLEEVLNLLRSGGLTLKLSKCCFFFDKIDFLGFEVSSDGIRPGTRKTEVRSRLCCNMQTVDRPSEEGLPLEMVVRTRQSLQNVKRGVSFQAYFSSLRSSTRYAIAYRCV